MDGDALEQAKERLSRARDALAILKGKGLRGPRESAWLDVISALGTVNSKLEQGAKANSKSAAWFTNRKRECKNDPLLQYVHQSRNAAEHGITRGSHYAKQAVSFTGMKPGTTAGLQMTAQGLKPFSTDPDMQLNFVEDDIVLMAVRNRGVVYPPPTRHLDSELEQTSASHVADLAVTYFEEMIIDAQNLVTGAV